MRADTLSLKDLFHKDVRYVVPTFQRSYVWKQDEQWEPLWEDVRNAAERYLDEVDRIGGDPATARAKAITHVGRHFMGAIVIQQQLTAAAELETRDVIDGQQRLTTLQLLADAAQQVTEEDGFAAEARRLRQIVVNRDVEGDDEFKLWPTLRDRDAFRAAMRSGDESDVFVSSRVAQAHAFFRLQIREWIKLGGEPDQQARRVHGLETALFALLQLVVIDLSTDDDAAVIFETLNARGTPLQQSDLVKNYVMQAAVAAGLDEKKLHAEHWAQLEDAWWQQEVRQGRLYRPRLDILLAHWLVMRTASEVQSHDVFPRFRAHVEETGRPVDEVLSDVARIAESYRKIEVRDTALGLDQFLYRWQTIEAGVATPVVLWLVTEPGISTADRDRSLLAVESFLVRRMACRLTTKDYNRLFIDLIERLRSDPTLAGDPVVSFLAEQNADAREWPDDDQLATAFGELPLFRLLTRGRLRLLLEAVEGALRGPLAETQQVPRNLTVEHVMPRSWSAHWPPPADDDRDAHLLRGRLLHSIGNLTLVNRRLNPTLSNAAWADKQGALDEHSVLHLNKRLLRDYRDRRWDEDGIRERGEVLAEYAARVWPSATELTR